MNISKNRLAFAAVAALALGITGLGAGSSAHAQDTLKVQKPFSVKLGVFLPTDGDIKDVFGSTWFSGGLSYDFAKSKSTSPVLYQLYFDYTERKKTYDGVDVTGRLLGVGPAAKFLLGSATSEAQPYVGIGIGYYDTKIAASDGGVTISRSEGRFGGKLFAGYQLKSGFFGEADYTYVSEIDGTQPGGVGLRLGYRF